MNSPAKEPATNPARANMPQAQTGHSPFQDQSTLSNNQRALLCLVGLATMLEAWGTYLIGFIMAFLIKPWGLTYGVMGTVLLASGAGAVLGGIVWGGMADRIGRKPVFVVSLLVFAAASVGLAFTPERGWVYMTVLRVILGFCTAGFLIQIALVLEFIPPRRRGMLTGVVLAINGGGMILGALSGAYIIPVIGWRWTFALGGTPAIIALIAAVYIPESPIWLSLHGRDAAARKSIAWALGGAAFEGEIDVPPQDKAQGWLQIFQCPKCVITTTLINLGLVTGYFGIVLWAPTLLSQVQSISLATAGKVMIGFSALGVPSRLIAAHLADKIGRRKTGGYFALAAGLATLLAGYVGQGDILSPSLFWLPLMLAFVFADGSFGVCSVYSSEVWPSRLRGIGSGYAGLTGSIGKILGPLGLALMAGSKDVVMPSATVTAIVPAFQFLAFCLFLCGLTYLVIGIEAKGRTLEAIDRGFENGRNG
jgi:MFS transporter, putative metabolite:H+ symporter